MGGDVAMPSANNPTRAHACVSAKQIRTTKDERPCVLVYIVRKSQKCVGRVTADDKYKQLTDIDYYVLESLIFVVRLYDMCSLQTNIQAACYYWPIKVVIHE